MACGSFLLADEPEDYKELGYENFKHFVIYEGLEDLANKIKFYLKHPEQRETIAKQGMGFVREFHNNSIRVKQFTDIINKELGVK
jgi:spore maturation protein CgeB